jgi:acyl carrier protein
LRHTVNIESIRQALHDHVVGELLLRDEPLGFDDDIFDAGFDSMSLSRLLVFIEERFGAVIPDEDVVIDDIATLNSLARFVASYLPKDP